MESHLNLKGMNKLHAVTVLLTFITLSLLLTSLASLQLIHAVLKTILMPENVLSANLLTVATKWAIIHHHSMTTDLFI